MLDVTSLLDFLGELAYTVSQIFALAFYIFVAGMGLYAIAAIVYNVALTRKRHRREPWEPPVAHITGKVYPDGKEVRGK